MERGIGGIIMDMKTVMIADLITSLICLAVSIQIWYYNRRKFSGLGFWTANWVLQLVGVLLITLRDSIPDWASVVLGNTLSGGGYAFCLYSVLAALPVDTIHAG